MAISTVLNRRCPLSIIKANKVPRAHSNLMDAEQHPSKNPKAVSHNSCPTVYEFSRYTALAAAVDPDPAKLSGTDGRGTNGEVYLFCLSINLTLSKKTLYR